MIKQNFFFLYRWMGPRKIPKSSTAYILILMCYELSRLIQSFALSAAICENKDYQTQVYTQDLGGPGIGQDVMLAVILEKRVNFTAIGGHFHWVEIMWQGSHVAWQTIQFFSGICMKKKFSSQARETHQLLSTNIAAVTSATNQQYGQETIRFQTEMAWYMHVNRKTISEK